MSNDDEKRRPVETLRDGAIEVSIWGRETENGTMYNTQRARSYQDQEGNWKRTNAIPERDLLRAGRLDEMAYASIQKLREQDRTPRERVDEMREGDRPKRQRREREPER